MQLFVVLSSNYIAGANSQAVLSFLSPIQGERPSAPQVHEEAGGNSQETFTMHHLHSRRKSEDLGLLKLKAFLPLGGKA